MTQFGTDAFALQIEDRSISTAGSSVEARTLVNLAFRAGGQALTSWTDQEDRTHYDAVPDVPLVDLAAWFAASWDRLIYELTVPASIAAKSLSPAGRWCLLSRVNDNETHRWAASHAVEFAATDYALPNVVFRRRDDFMEVSWDPRPTTGPGSTVLFDAKPGSALIAVEEFVALARDVLSWVRQRCVEIENDERLDEIRTILDQDATVAGRRALRGWFRDYKAAAFPIDAQDLANLGRKGASSNTSVMFLRSAAGAISASEAARILKLVPKYADRPPAADSLQVLAEGLNPTIAPETPWDSGLFLARVVRARLGIKADARADIGEVLSNLSVGVRPHRFSALAIEGACFLTHEGVALAFYNPVGRLSKTATGRRTTLSHELCHLLFDAPQRALGQLDLRFSVTGASLIEMRANAFAAEFLLPREAVLASSEAGRLSVVSAAELARRFQVSKWVVRHQAENQELLVEEIAKLDVAHDEVRKVLAATSRAEADLRDHVLLLLAVSTGSLPDEADAEIDREEPFS